MDLPDFPQISTATLHAIVERHGLGASTFARMPEVGIFNAIYRIGDHLILRVPRAHPAFIASAHKEAVAVSAARAAGVRTPRIVVFDDACDLLPVPYTVYERVEGETLGLLTLDPNQTPEAWREVGRDLALLHAGVAEQGPVAALECEHVPDPRSWPDELAAAGYFTALEARWLLGWLDRLAPAALAPVPRRFLHGDVQATNIMVETGTLDYRAVLDWGSAGWGDPAWDFAGMPLGAVPFLLEGYRAIAPLDGDDTAEARILWRHLQLALYLLQREPQPDRAWAERPMAMLLEIMRFLVQSPGQRWRQWLV